MPVHIMNPSWDRGKADIYGGWQITERGTTAASCLLPRPFQAGLIDMQGKQIFWGEISFCRSYPRTLMISSQHWIWPLVNLSQVRRLFSFNVDKNQAVRDRLANVFRMSKKKNHLLNNLNVQSIKRTELLSQTALFSFQSKMKHDTTLTKVYRCRNNLDATLWCNSEEEEQDQCLLLHHYLFSPAHRYTNVINKKQRERLMQFYAEMKG